MCKKLISLLTVVVMMFATLPVMAENADDETEDSTAILEPMSSDIDEEILPTSLPNTSGNLLDINAVMVDDTNYTISVELTCQNGIQGTVVAAFYDVNSTLLSMFSCDASDVVTFSGIDNNKYKTLRVFWWYSLSSMYPMAESVSFNLEDVRPTSAATTTPYVDDDAAEILYSGTCGADGSDLTWTLNSNGELHISGIGNMETYDAFSSVPWYYYSDSIRTVIIDDGVTTVCDYAFCECTDLTSITLPDSLTSIGEEAFSDCTGLTSITLPNGLSSIGGWAFLGCTSLESVHISDISAYLNIEFNNSLANPLYYAHNLYLNDELLTDLNVPDTVTSISNYAFYDCTSLTSIIMSDSVTSIGSNAFYRCTSLTSVNLPTSVTSIGTYAFRTCSGLKNVYISDIAAYLNIEFGNSNSNPMIYADELYLNGSLVTSLDIPDMVTTIPDYAFDGCASLTNINLPDSMISIGECAFSGCTNLTSIALPDSVTSIGDWAFYDCTDLKSVYISDIAAYLNIEFGDYVSCPMYYADELYLNGSLVTSLDIPDTVTAIPNDAFYGCASLTNVNLPDGLISVDDYAFYYCTGLSSITLPDSIINIGEYAFYGCAKLTSIILPNSVTSIGEMTFYYCTGLTSLTLSDNLESIGDCAFSGCSGLTNIILPENLTFIDNEAFSNCTGLISITIPSSVIKIGDATFRDCEALVNVYYTGSEAEWDEISIGSDNTYLTNATITYNYAANE